MAEDFTSPIGLRSESLGETWSIVVLDDGTLQMRSNSLVGDGTRRLAMDDDSGEVSIGTSNDPTTLTVTERVNLADTSDTARVRLSAPGQRIELLNTDGEIISMLGGSGNIRAGSNGEAGDLFLFPAGASDIFANGDASASIRASTGDMFLGGNDVGGDLFVRDGENTVRARLSAGGQRIELSNRQGQIIGMLGGGGNVRAGTSGETGELYLFGAQASNIFSNGDATMSLNAGNGDANFGGNGVNGDLFLRDANGNARARLRAGSQRLEFLNAAGEIIGMMGGAGNVRSGSNGDGGDLYLFPDDATDIFDNSQATIRMNGNSGNISVDGDITLQNADCAEDFKVACPVEAEPGTVMVIGDDLELGMSCKAYDRRVAGIVAGAGDYRPGIVLGRTECPDPTMPIALVGRACCKVDARQGPIAIGDLLTTSPTPGHAMKAEDPERAFGAVIGKALAPLPDGQGLIPVLVALQ